MDREPDIVVVSNPETREELLQLLAQSGFGRVRLAPADDATTEALAEASAIVVLTATVPEGDARSFAAALRGGEGSAVRIVLVGDAVGPIRNALDASDFDVDKFVGRPLNAKTLEYAVRACVDAAGGLAPDRPIDRATDHAIASFVDEAINALGADPMLEAALGVAREESPFLATAPTAINATDPGSRTPNLREQTLILSGGGVAQVLPSAASAGSPWDDGGEAIEASAPAPGRRREPSAAEIEDTGVQSPPTGAPIARIATQPGVPEVGGLGGELRRKMAAMAERLFPNLGAAGRRVDGEPTHDAHTDIDLAALGGDARGYVDQGEGDTFADTNPLAALEPTPSGDGTPAGEATGDGTRRRRAATGELPARGDLAVIDVGFLFARVWSRGFTGQLAFRRGPAEKLVQFDDGRPVFATSNQPHDRMGDLLYREGKITREQHRQARESVVESGRRMGEILVELGFIKPRELLPTVRRHLEDIIYSLFGWEGGEFVATPGEPTGERIRLTRHPAGLVLEGVRRKHDLARLAVRLGTPQAIVAARPSRQLSALISVADLSTTERALVGKLDGERTLDAAARLAELDVLPAMQVTYVLVALGVAEVIDRGVGEAPPASARGPVLVGESDLAIDRQRVTTKHALVDEADYFMLLGVRRDATGFEIRRAYEAARRDFAPEGFPAELQRELAGELAEINSLIDEAYRVLRDEGVRSSYLANLRD